MTAIFLLGINPDQTETGAVSEEIPNFVPYLVVVVIVLFMLGMQAGPGPVMWVMLSEIFPNAVRGAANGFAVMILWLTKLMVRLLFSVMMSVICPVISDGLFAAL